MNASLGSQICYEDPAYRLFFNNCQHFAKSIIEKARAPRLFSSFVSKALGGKEFDTTLDEVRTVEEAGDIPQLVNADQLEEFDWESVEADGLLLSKGLPTLGELLHCWVERAYGENIEKDNQYYFDASSRV